VDLSQNAFFFLGMDRSNNVVAAVVEDRLALHKKEQKIYLVNSKSE
jgi:hypothetical protein